METQQVAAPAAPAQPTNTPAPAKPTAATVGRRPNMKHYGELKRMMRVKSGQGVGGLLFVNRIDGQDQGEIASLSLEVDGVEGEPFTYLWPPRKPHVTGNGSTLLFRNLPNFKAGEDFHSESYLLRKVEVYEGKYGTFAIVPGGLLNLEPTTLRVQQTFNTDELRRALAARKDERAAYKARSPIKKAKPSDLLEAASQTVLQAIRDLQGEDGVSQEAVLSCPQLAAMPERVRNEALDLLLRGTSVTQPKLAMLKAA